MTKDDRSERKSYRRSPGRQYGYDYDPVRNQNNSGYNQSERLESSPRDERWQSRSENPSRPLSQSAPRPNLRRTRQLLRQNILASKSRPYQPGEELEEETFDIPTRQEFNDNDQNMYEEQEDSTLYSNRYNARRKRATPTAHQFAEAQRADEPEVFQPEEEWDEFNFVDPDLGYEDPLDQRVAYPAVYPVRPAINRPASRQLSTNQQELEEDEVTLIKKPAPRKRKKRGVTRRRLLWGLGIAAVGGTAVAAYELAPKLPQSLGDLGTNITKQLQDEFNKGIKAGEDALRKEFINELENLEGVSIDAAISAARLTRIAYDTFVSPLVTLAATVTGDFLSITLRALIKGRQWLANIGQDNATLQALQTVLETWVKQLGNMPKQIQAITDTDLDGAQSYLRALQQKIQDEKAKLNSSTTPTPNATTTTNPTKTSTPSK